MAYFLPHSASFEIVVEVEERQWPANENCRRYKSKSRERENDFQSPKNKSRVVIVIALDSSVTRLTLNTFSKHVAAKERLHIVIVNRCTREGGST